MSISKSLIIEKFGSVDKAAQALGYTRKTLYNLIKNGLNNVAKKRIKMAGYNPETFNRVKNN